MNLLSTKTNYLYFGGYKTVNAVQKLPWKHVVALYNHICSVTSSRIMTKKASKTTMRFTPKNGAQVNLLSTRTHEFHVGGKKMTHAFL